MSQRPKPKLSADRVNELIAEADEIDRQNARLAIRSGVKGAEDQWVSAPMIAEALTMELVSYVQTARSPSETAAFLRALAEAIEAQPNVN